MAKRPVGKPAKKKKPGRKPIPKAMQRPTLSVIMGPHTATFLREFGKSENLRLGRAAEYLMLLGAKYLAKLEEDGEEKPPYAELATIEFEIAEE